MAHELIDSAGEVKKRSRSMADALFAKDRDEMMVGLVVANSLERMLDYMANIGELTINLRNSQLSDAGAGDGS